MWGHEPFWESGGLAPFWFRCKAHGVGGGQGANPPKADEFLANGTHWLVNKTHIKYGGIFNIVSFILLIMHYAVKNLDIQRHFNAINHKIDACSLAS